MGASQPAPVIREQWNYIVNTLRNEMQAGGKLNGCSWTDVAGTARSSSMIDVRASHHLWTQLLDPKTLTDPRTGGVCGVQPLPWTTAPSSSSRRNLVTEFEIVVAVNSIEQVSGSNKIPPNGDDALAQAWSFIEDGTGKGITEIFRANRQNYTLGGNANEINIVRGDVQTMLGVGATPQLLAYVSLVIRAEQPIMA